MRNPALAPLDVLVGEWALTLTDAWFLESRDIRQQGRATARWLGDAFIELEAEMEGEHMWHFVLGHSDPNQQLVALYHDPRSTSRLFHMTFPGDEWTLHREDPDFHQRFVAHVGATASTDAGARPRIEARRGARTSTSPSSGPPRETAAPGHGPDRTSRRPARRKPPEVFDPTPVQWLERRPEG